MTTYEAALEKHLRFAVAGDYPAMPIPTGLDPASVKSISTLCAEEAGR